MDCHLIGSFCSINVSFSPDSASAVWVALQGYWNSGLCHEASAVENTDGRDFAVLNLLPFPGTAALECACAVGSETAVASGGGADCSAVAHVAESNVGNAGVAGVASADESSVGLSVDKQLGVAEDSCGSSAAVEQAVAYKCIADLAL